MGGDKRSAAHSAALVEARRRLVAGDRDTARHICDAVLSDHPGQPDAEHYLGVIAYLEHRHEDAVTLMARARRQRRADSELHSNLGLAYQALGQFAPAIDAFRRALAIAPGHAAHHAYLGAALRDAGRLDEARLAYDRALSIDARYALARYGKGLCSLLAGDWQSPWENYEWRFAADFGAPYARDPRRPGAVLPRPSEWTGQDCSSSRVLILSDQGIGDELFFLRFAAGARARCAWLGYQASPKLLPLLGAGVPGIDAVFNAAEPVTQEPDRSILVGDLPLLSRMRVQAAQASICLTPCPNLIESMLERLTAAGPAPWLALTWRAGPQPTAGEKPGRRKEVPLTALAAPLKNWPGTVISVQRNPLRGEFVTLNDVLGQQVPDFGEFNDDLPAMLALLSVVDEYVGVSNTNMHLRAAARRRAKVLVTVPPDWRWTETGTTSPWFPDFDLYREERLAGWGAAMTRLATDLSHDCRPRLERGFE